MYMYSLFFTVEETEMGPVLHQVSVETKVEQPKEIVQAGEFTLLKVL